MTKEEIVAAIKRVAEEGSGVPPGQRSFYQDILTFLPAEDAAPAAASSTRDVPTSPPAIDGFVYLLRFGKYYKVGRTEAVLTRHRPRKFM